ncbi:MAG: hypothetical protein ACTSYO_05755 [Candidatus Ranarchaeia archaeon]
MYKNYEVQIQLREEKENGKFRKKHTKKLKMVISDSRLDAILDELPNREKQTLTLSVFELDDTGKTKKDPVRSRQIFPTKIEYTRLLKLFEPEWGEGTVVYATHTGLFKYYAKVKGIEILKGNSALDDFYVHFYPVDMTVGDWNKFVNYWNEFSNYNNIKKNTLAAIADPDSDPEEFKSLLESHKVIDTVIVKNDNEDWEVRREAKTNKYIVSGAKDSVALELSQLKSIFKALYEEHTLGLRYAIQE